MPGTDQEAARAQAILDLRNDVLNNPTPPGTIAAPTRDPISFQRDQPPADIATGQSIPGQPSPTEVTQSVVPVSSPAQQKQEIVNDPTKTAAASSTIHGTPSLNARQQELMNAEAVNQEPVEGARSNVSDELARARIVADEVTKQKNEMLIDHAETMHGLIANQQLHSQMATTSADQVAADIKKQMDNIQPINTNPGVFTKRANIEAGDSGGQIGLKILGAIGQAAAMAGGAFGAGITHSRNFAMDIINDQIARNVAGQKENNEKKWQQINVTHQLGNDQQLKYAHMLEQDNRNELSERYKVADYLTFMQEKTANQDARTRLAQLGAENESKIADVKNNMSLQRYNFLNANANHAQAVAREEAHRLEDRHDKYVEHAMSKAGGELSPDEAEARWSQQTGTNYQAFKPPSNMPISNSIPNDLAMADSKGTVRKMIGPEAKQYGVELTATRMLRADLDAYEKDPSQHNYDRAILSASQVAGLKRAPGTAPGIMNAIKGGLGISTGNTVADSIPTPGEMKVSGSKGLTEARDALNQHAQILENQAFGKPPFKEVP